MSTTPGTWLNTEGAAQRLGLAPWTVRQMAREGRVRAFRLGPRGHLRFRPEDLDAALTPAAPRG